MNIARFSRAVAVLLTLAPSPAQQPPQDQAPATFQSQARLVLLPFRVSRGKNYATDLAQSAVTLLEDGKPREFTIFDTPTSQGRLPIEIVLLFDTNPKIEYMWDPQDVFRFIPQWSEDLSRAVLQRGKNNNPVEVRVSVYRCSGRTLYRSAPPTTDPHVLTSALQAVLQPAPVSPDPESEIALTLPPQRNRVDPGPFTRDYVTSPFYSAAYRGWPMEAAIGLLNEVSAAQDRVARVLVMFSEGIGATTTIPEDAGNQALDLGIPIYPIATNYKHHISRILFKRNYFRMHEFEALGKMTGGRASEYASIDAVTLRKILDGVIGDALAQYVAGFIPSSGEGAARQHQLEIRLTPRSTGVVEGGKRRAVY